MSPYIVEKLTPIFRTTFADPALVPRRDMAAKDVAKWNSLTHVEMIAAVEKAFGLRFSLKDMMKMKNVGDMADIIQTHLDKK